MGAIITALSLTGVVLISLGVLFAIVQAIVTTQHDYARNAPRWAMKISIWSFVGSAGFFLAAIWSYALAVNSW